MSEDHEKSFAELFEASEMNLGAEIKVGDRVKGRIITIGKDMVYVDTGTKTDGVIDKLELFDKDGNFPFKEGDIVELFVVSRQQNEIRLGRSAGGAGGLEQLQQAMEANVPVEGKVKETCKGGFRVRVMDQIAFCPLSQIDIHQVEDPESMVGETFHFLITRLEERGRNIVVSRRALQEQEQAQSLETFTSETKPGDVLQGTVTRVVPFGAFVEVAPGLEGLVHISELSWSRTASPEDIVTPGDKVTVKFLNLEDQGKGRVRMGLSMKQAQADPWDEASKRFKAGDKLTGTVTRIAPFGAFVEIAPGIEGLVHISEMSYVQRVHKPGDLVAEGDKIPVMIKDMDLQKRRIGLSMRDAEGDPWQTVPDKYQKGKVVQGVVEKRESFGVFIRLEPGVVGLLPASRVDRTQGMSLDKFKPGDTLQVVVDTVDLEKRRISLAPAEAVQSEEWKSYAPQEEKLGTLGEQLREALQQKKGS